MSLLKNRIVISLIVLFALLVVWEFKWRPQSGPIYRSALTAYQRGDYATALKELDQAYNIDPNSTSIVVLMGWAHLKSGHPERAEYYFGRARKLDKNLLEAKLGLVYTYMAERRLDESFKLLNEIEATDPGRRNVDILLARATRERLTGDITKAVELFRRVLEIEKDEPVATTNLKEFFGYEGYKGTVSFDLPPLEGKPGSSTFRAAGDYLEEREGSEWKPVFLKGVNLNLALPGRYSSEPPNDVPTYSTWLNQIAQMNGNAVRARAIMPAAFYRALRQHNQSGGSKIYLLQEAWFGEPPDGDFFKKDFTEAARAEVRYTIDSMHGQGRVSRREGLNYGIYTEDVSPYAIGFLLGREMEPHLVLANNQKNASRTSYSGKYVTVAQGNATEVWLAELADYAIGYEIEHYRAQRPIAFANWAPLDPLTHPTESSTEEERRMRARAGEKSLPPQPAVVDDDDAVSLDPTKMKATSAFTAGLFASYAVSPYYPDFMNLDSGYLKGKDSQGGSSFAAYVQELRRYHQGIPLLVAEFGIPSSMGVSHVNPLGWNHGGHSEAEQGNYLARMITSISESGCAGGLTGSWIDEWYRQSWLIRDFEVPGAHARLWLNALNPDEQQGLVGFKTSRQDAYRLTGDASRWPNSMLLYEKDAKQPLAKSYGDAFDAARRLRRVYVDSDQAYVYLRLDVEKLDANGDGQPDWDQVNYLIGLRVTASAVGSKRFPLVSDVQVPSGLNFVVRLGRPDSSRILIASVYNPYQVAPTPGIPEQSQVRYRVPFLPELSDDARFEEMIVEPNRRRYGRDGRAYAPVRYSRSPLQWGTLEPGSSDYTTLAEWHANVKTNMLEVRIPWGLLQVTDPSSLQVLGGIDRTGTFYTEKSNGLAVAVVSLRPDSKDAADVLPKIQSGVIPDQALKPYKWEPWDSVDAKPYLKDSYTAVQKAFGGLRAAGRRR